METITANVPAKTVTWKSKQGQQTRTTEAYTAVFNQDDEGRWSSPDFGALLEDEVIDVCKNATNWGEIKSAHFPMHGFHS